MAVWCTHDVRRNGEGRVKGGGPRVRGEGGGPGGEGGFLLLLLQTGTQRIPDRWSDAADDDDDNNNSNDDDER